MLLQYRLVPSRFSCTHCGLRVGFDEFAVHQGKDGRKLRGRSEALRAFPNSNVKRHVLKPRRWILDDRRWTMDDRRWTICPFLTDGGQICHTIFREFRGIFFSLFFECPFCHATSHERKLSALIITRHLNLSRNRGQKRINERLLYVCPRTTDAHLRLDFWQTRAKFVTQSLGKKKQGV